ncbi:MAG: CDP-alcohol phosphatidyltransferase family protein [Oscillospiraceae bacterium]|nr:CDP-alcohol phosphatidyltransferase family protein [Oscillospiraceae bacterium]
MIGFYDYTVILTYLSPLSAVGGMALAMTGHPIWATMCLLFCGLCDMFDGMVARTKKNRSDEEKAFGIQIDSLSDIVAFGALPAVIVMSLCRGCWYAYAVAPLYVLAGLIRLGYYNVTEELRTKQTQEARKDYSGLPITSAALIFPIAFCGTAVYCICTYGDILPYKDMFAGSPFGVGLTLLMALTGLCFLLPFKIRKPRTKELLLFLIVGILIAIVLLFALFL